MTLAEAVQVLVLGAGRSFQVLDTQGLRTLFPDDGDGAFNRGLRRLRALGLLERVGRGVYVNRGASPLGRSGIGLIAGHLRPRHLCYLSYESALAEFGSISQVPMIYIVATTGNRGQYRTRCGDLEFCHTSRHETEILANTVFDDRFGMRVASPALACEDLRRVRPNNLHLIDDEIHAEALADWERTPLGGNHA